MSLSEDKEMRVEEHLMECEPCTARELHRVAQVLDWWTAISHGAAARAEAFAASSIREVVARGIRGTQERVHDPALGERLARWARRWEEQAQAAVRVVVEGPGTASRVVVEGLDALTRPASSRQLTPAVAPTRGTLGAPEPTELTLALGPGAPRARIEVSGDRGDIVVRLEPPSPRPEAATGAAGGCPERRSATSGRPSDEPGLPYALVHFLSVVPGE